MRRALPLLLPLVMMQQHTLLKEAIPLQGTLPLNKQATHPLDIHHHNKGTLLKQATLPHSRVTQAIQLLHKLAIHHKVTLPSSSRTTLPLNPSSNLKHMVIDALVVVATQVQYAGQLMQD